jgi:NADH-quinone oxidoreductase subunit C
LSLESLQQYIAKETRFRLKVELHEGELTIFTEPNYIAALLHFLRDDRNCLFAQLLDVCGADYPEREKRFEVIYHLLSIAKNQRVRVKVAVGEDEQVPTAEGVFSTANWFEREAFDMYGIEFKDSKDLRRILTDYGFEGHPLRKDFPLSGHVEVRYDIEQEKVVYEPVKLDQEYRNFDFLSPWEGTDYNLPVEKIEGDNG